MFSKDAGSLLFERNKIIDLAHLFGHSTIDAVLDLSVLYFTVPEVNGFIAYRLEAGCAIVFGPPVCLEDEMLLLLKAFHQHFQEKKTNIVYLIVTEDFAKWAEGRFCASAIEFGAELFVNPKEDTSKIGAKGALLRKKLRRAFKEGVSVAEYFSFDALFETQMEKAAAFWLSSRKGPQIHTASVKLFEDRLGRRWFYAKGSFKNKL